MTVALKIESTFGTKMIPLSLNIPILYIKDAVRDELGYVRNGHYEIVARGEVSGWFHEDRTLGSYGVKEGDILTFLDLGDAV